MAVGLCYFGSRLYVGLGLGWLGELKFSVFFRVIARCARRVR